MIYTVRFAHLDSAPHHRVGDYVHRGDLIGRMGSTGQSTGPHLHIDCSVGPHPERYTIADMEHGIVMPAPRQLNWFIDSELFGCPFVVTTPYCDADYMRDYDKLHLGYDVIPRGGANGAPIYWGRSMRGEVLAVRDDPAYGHLLQIGFVA